MKYVDSLVIVAKKMSNVKDLKPLMIKAQAGDQQAYAELLEALYPLIQRYLSKKLGVLGREEDFVQECVLALHKARHTYDSTRDFMPWMYTVVKYKAIDILRKKQRVWANELQNEEISATFSSPEANISDEDKEVVRKALDGLPENMRRAVELTKFEGLSTEEASEKEGISTQALRSRVSRAYKILRKRLEKDFDG